MHVSGGRFLAVMRRYGCPGGSFADLCAHLRQIIGLDGWRHRVDLQVTGNCDRTRTKRTKTLCIQFRLRDHMRKVFEQRLSEIIPLAPACKGAVGQTSIDEYLRDPAGPEL